MLPVAPENPRTLHSAITDDFHYSLLQTYTTEYVHWIERIGTPSEVVFYRIKHFQYKWILQVQQIIISHLYSKGKTGTGKTASVLCNSLWSLTTIPKIRSGRYPPYFPNEFYKC